VCATDRVSRPNCNVNPLELRFVGITLRKIDLSRACVSMELELKYQRGNDETGGERKEKKRKEKGGR